MKASACDLLGCRAPRDLSEWDYIEVPGDGFVLHIEINGDNLSIRKVCGALTDPLLIRPVVSNQIEIPLRRQVAPDTRKPER